MNVVDSSGWLEWFGGGPNAEIFEAPIVDNESLVIPSVCIYEVAKRVMSQFGEDAALKAAGVMSVGVVADMDRQTALEAAQISLQEGLAMADSMILATARRFEALLWTMDAHFKGMEGVKYVEKRE